MNVMGIQKQKKNVISEYYFLFIQNQLCNSEDTQILLFNNTEQLSPFI